MYKIAFLDDQEPIHDLFKKFKENDNLVKENDIEFKMFEDSDPGDEVINKLSAYEPNLLFLDLLFNKSTNHAGLELLPKLRQKLPNVKIVMLSNEAEIKNIKKAILKGASGYIYKVDTGSDEPDFTELIKITKELIDGNKQIYFSPTIVEEITIDLEYDNLPSDKIIIENFQKELFLSEKKIVAIVLRSLEPKITNDDASYILHKGIESYKKNLTNLYKKIISTRKTNAQLVMEWVKEFGVLAHNRDSVEKVMAEIIDNVKNDPKAKKIINEKYGGVDEFLKKCADLLKELKTQY